MKRYVLGFCFLPDWSCILIERTKQDWQFGLVNGLGGSIKPHEITVDAMVREFYEECGIATHRKDWEFAVHLGDDEKWALSVLRAKLLYYPRSIRSCDEGIVRIYQEPPAHMERTARWLYWMCRDESTFGMLVRRH